MAQQIKEFKRLDFTHNRNNKLLCMCFTTIRPDSNKYKVGETFDVRLSERHFCYAKVLDIRKEIISRIIELNYHITDAGVDAKTFIQHMEGFYSKKNWWNGVDTLMQIVFFEKIIQMDLFEDNEKYA